MSGAEAIQRIVERFPRALCGDNTYRGDAQATRAFKAGATSAEARGLVYIGLAEPR